MSSGAGHHDLAVAIGAAQVAITTLERSASTTPRPVVRYAIQSHSIFTEILQDFERSGDIYLRDCRCAISIPGAARGQNITVARSRWTLSRSGLETLFDGNVKLINEVAAAAWAATARGAVQIASGSVAPMPTFSQPGRWAVISIAEGVGVAAIDVDAEGSTRVLECEGGHCAFAPANPVEDQFMAAFRRTATPASWERIITANFGDPVWAGPDLPTGRDKLSDCRNALIGAFVGDMMLALGAWDGAILTGHNPFGLSTTVSTSAFRERLEGKSVFQRQLRQAPCFYLEGRDLALEGSLAALADWHSHVEHQRMQPAK